MKKIALICNPLPEKRQVLLLADAIARILTKRAISYSIFTTYWPQVWDQFSEAWIVGGDGTLNYFINENPEFSLPIAIFKGGTGNDFHWALYGNLSLENQVENVLKGSIIKVDAGVCNGRLFINGIGIGFDGIIVQDLLGKKKRRGKSSYLLAILKNIITYREGRFHFQIDKKRFSRECFMVSIANGNCYGGGFHIAPQAVLTDGLLDVVITGKIPPLKRLFYLPVIEKGNHLQLPFIQYNTCNKIKITTDHFLPAHADGEYFSANSFVIECLPKRFSFLR